MAARDGPITLVYSARDTQRDAAVALREHLTRTLHGDVAPPGRQTGRPRAEHAPVLVSL